MQVLRGIASAHVQFVNKSNRIINWQGQEYNLHSISSNQSSLLAKSALSIANLIYYKLCTHYLIDNPVVCPEELDSPAVSAIVEVKQRWSLDGWPKIYYV
jgi:hypothetical protein